MLEVKPLGAVSAAPAVFDEGETVGYPSLSGRLGSLGLVGGDAQVLGGGEVRRSAVGQSSDLLFYRPNFINTGALTAPYSRFAEDGEVDVAGLVVSPFGDGHAGNGLPGVLGEVSP